MRLERSVGGKYSIRCYFEAFVYIVEIDGIVGFKVVD